EDRQEGRQEGGKEGHEEVPGEEGRQEDGQEGHQEDCEEGHQEDGEEGRRQEVTGQEGGQEGHEEDSRQEDREQDRQEGGKEAGSAQGQGAGRLHPGCTRTLDVSNPDRRRHSPSPAAQAGEGVFSWTYCGLAVEPALPDPPDPTLRGVPARGAGQAGPAPSASALARSRSAPSSRSTSSHCGWPRPMARSRIVGSRPVGRLLSPFHNTTAPRSRSGIRAISPRYPWTAPAWKTMRCPA